jgi:plasmid maintenance system antidote protein VapI
MQKRKSDIESQLRRAIIESSMSRYKIAKLSGIGEAPLSLFVNRKRTLTLTSAAKVADVLDLELVSKKTKRKAGEL